MSSMGRSSICSMLRFLAFLYLFNMCSSHSEMSRLLMVSFDGFRWDYLDVAKAAGRATPNFDKLVSRGVSISGTGIENAFITKTFPNHYTLVTGLYEENHGIVANYFYDPVFNEEFKIDDAKSQKWWNGTGSRTVVPVWVTNEKASHGLAGPPRASGVFFWPGSDVDGQRPTYYKPYDKNLDFKKRVDGMVGWLSDEVKPINLGLIYFHEPDSTGHRFGPKSKEMVNMIVSLDEILGYLITKLGEHEMFESTNLIITSDHGMVDMDGSVYLDDFVDPSLYRAFGRTPVLNILPYPGKEDAVYEALKKAPNLIVYWKSDIPAQYHYTNNRRIQPILVTANEGYRLCQNRTFWCNDTGNHGYNNSFPSMHPIFIAHGPAFKKNYIARPFKSVDVYSLICHILNIDPLPNDGSLENVRHVLADDDDEDDDVTLITGTRVIVVGSIGLVSLISVVCCIGAIRSYVTYSRKPFAWQKDVPDSLKMVDNGNNKPLLVSEEEEDIA